MDFNAVHAGFVELSYALSAVFLVGLVVYVLGRDRALAKKVRSLKEKTDA
jgi:heme exporter protein CcmD